MRRVASGAWGKVMAVALMGSIVICVLLATTVAAIEPPPQLVVKTAQEVTVIAPDCSRRNIEQAQRVSARMQRELDGEDPLGEFGEWARSELAKSRALLTACRENAKVSPCFDYELEVRMLEQIEPLSRLRDGELEAARRQVAHCQGNRRH